MFIVDCRFESTANFTTESTLLRRSGYAGQAENTEVLNPELATDDTD